MAQELTTADGFTLESATNEDHDYDHTSDLTEKVNVDRWSKGGHDRLYVNNLNWDCYVDLTDGSVHVDGGSKLTPIGTELDGDELTITVVYGRKNFPDRTNTFVVKVHGDKFEAADETHECDECGRDFDSERGVAIHKGHKHTADENETDDETTTDATAETTEAVADGGDDSTDQFTDEEIAEAIDQHDDLDYPEATTITEARTYLADVQQSLEDYWDHHMDAIDEGHMSVVYEDSEALVVADHSGHGWTEERDALGIDDVTGKVLKSVHHKVAERLCDYSWQSSNPFVVAKPADWQTGEFHVERRVAHIATAADASEAAAMDYWSVEIKGRSQSEWARLVGKSQQTVSGNIQKVENGLGAELS